MIGTGEPNVVAIAFFLGFIVLSLGITVWASRRTRTADHFYSAGRSVTAFQNGLALAGDYMSAASFLGIAGLVAMSGFDGLIYSIGFLVGWPIVMFLIAEPLRKFDCCLISDGGGAYVISDARAVAASDAPRGIPHEAYSFTLLRRGGFALQALREPLHPQERRPLSLLLEARLSTDGELPCR